MADKGGGNGEATVFLVDDDADIRDALDALLRSVGLKVETFSSVEVFRGSGRIGAPGCLLLDVRLSGQSGLSFQADLRRAGHDMPIIFMSAHADVPMAVAALKAGASEFLTKPVRPQELIDAVNHALAVDRARQRHRRDANQSARAYARLTAREREVMALIVAGHSNKTVAARLGRSEATIKVHRANVMRKTGARTLAHLVEMAQILKSAP